MHVGDLSSMSLSYKCMWEILVPTIKPIDMSIPSSQKQFFTTRYHKVWDEKVRAISGGLTILHPVKGQWVSPKNSLFIERMIPVRVIATRDEINEIIDMTIKYYSQAAVLCYKISDEVILRHAEKL